MLEKDMEELIANYPNDFFPDYNLQLNDRQGILDNTARFDLLFNDKSGNIILMELKSKKASADNIDQIITYQDKLIRKNRKNKINVKMWLIAPNIPYALQKKLKEFNIKFFEINEDIFNRIARKRNYPLQEKKIKAKKKITRERKSTRLNSSHITLTRMPFSA